ncbi:SDR family oxidoreductase [Erwinia sp. JUb26]|uniref:SDR family oxidoreductase n=1 Tax=Erwinia sp. JUb26 TaxID=2485126 RepID=UPI000F486973|nr:D-threitol dehydrogenase [Erwinia sp. JUb26]ROR04702.1 NAD(P)-dependent dehydrogenase (short-subunit alcohol dehydrogenase family) [Erwinia sp. JUb26]
MSTELAGKVALITGGAAGIGYAIAECFLQHGASVALFDRDPAVADVARTLDAQRAIGLAVDVTCRQAVYQAVEQTVGHFGRLDIAVNCAGVALLAPAESLSEEAWDRTLDINLKGTFLVSQAAGQHFLRQKSGNIINMASQASVVALPQHLAYCASKAAVVGLTQVLALEWGPHNINVNAISPTVVLTELGAKAWAGEAGEAHKKQIPLRRFAEPAHIAATALFLASPGAAMMNGANVVVDGGFTIC